MERTRRRSRWLAAVAVAVSAITIFAWLGSLPLLEPDESRNAEVAREMKESGAWLVPTYNGLPYLDKPAFYFKVVGVSLGLFGETETAARLPSALAACLLLVLVYGFCRREYNPRCAALAVIVVATSPLFVAFSRLVIFEMTLALFVTASVMAGYLAEQHEGRARTAWYAAGVAASALATLVKGPIGFILPTLVLAVFNLVDRRRGWLKRFLHPLNLLVFLAIVLPWFVGVSRLRPDFPYYGLVMESFQRFTTPSFHRTKPFYFYGTVIAVGLCAWSLLLPESVWAAWQGRRRWTRADRLFVVWALASVAFFSLSRSKMEGYILTATVALGALLARVFDGALEMAPGRRARIVAHGAAGLAVLAAGAAIYCGLARFCPHALESLTGRASLALPPAALAKLLGLCAVVAVAAAAGSWLKQTRVALAAFLLVVPAAVLISFQDLKVLLRIKDSRALARQLARLPADVEIACLECYPTGVPFYLRRYITVLSTDGGELASNYVEFTLRQSTNWPPVIVPWPDRDRWLATRDHDVYLVSRKDDLSMLRSNAAARGVTVRELGGYWGALIPGRAPP